MEPHAERYEDPRPWEQLEELMETPDAEQLEAFLDALPSSEMARTLSRLSEADQNQVFTLLSPEEAADLVEELPEAQAADVLERLTPEVAGAIFQELPSDEQADLFNELGEEEAAAILAAMDPQEAKDLQELSQYPEDVAGGLMITEFLAYPHQWSIAEVVSDFQLNADTYRDYQVQYAYVCDQAGCPIGVLRLRDLLFARHTQRVDEVMTPALLTVSDTMSLDELHGFFARHHWLGVPVTDATGKLIGVVLRLAVEEALAERSDSDYLKSQGIVGGEELRTMPIGLRARRRLSWLSVNIVLNIIAASVIAWYQETLAAVIALAVFLPIISDMSGCSGNQAVAVSIRELALGLARPGDMLRVWGKELLVGLINGTVLGLLIAGVAWLWQGNPFLGLVVGAAMAVNTLVSVSIGGTVPLLLRRFNLDPALASGPILTTITDMCGFFLILSAATVLLPYLLAP